MGDDVRLPSPNPADPSVDDLEALLADPPRWARLESALLGQLYRYQCLSVAAGARGAASARLMALARVAAEQLVPAHRLQIVVGVGRAIEQLHRRRQVHEGAGCTPGLLPFLLTDPDPSVVATAAMEMAVLRPLERDNALTGPAFVASLADQTSGDEARAGLIAGLLQLGDDRVEPLLAGAWGRLGGEGRQTLALLIQGFRGLTTMTARFLLAWLEAEVHDPLAASFGIVAATMARAGGHAAEHGIVEVRRVFPLVTAPEGQAVATVRHWTLPEWLPTVSARLVRTARLEQPPQLMPQVLSHWGLVRQGYDICVEAVAAEARGRPLSEPAVLEVSPAWDDQDGMVAEWGGMLGESPAIDRLRVTRLPRRSVAALVQTRYSAAGSASWLLGVVAGDAGRPVLSQVVGAACTGRAWTGTRPLYVHVPACPALAAADVVDVVMRERGTTDPATFAAERREWIGRTAAGHVQETRRRLLAVIDESRERGTMVGDD